LVKSGGGFFVPILVATDSKSLAKECGRFLAILAGRGIILEPNADLEHKTYMFLRKICEAFEELARSNGADAGEAALAENQRQIADIIAVSPLLVLR